MGKLTGSRMVLLFAAVIIIISGLSVISALSLYNNIKLLLVEEKSKKAMSVTIAVAEFIEQDYSSFRKLLETDDYSDGSYDSKYYEKMERIFRDIRKRTGVEFLYCGKRISEHEMIYLFDGVESDSPLFSSLGSKDDLDAQEREIYQSKISGYTSIVNDPVWGELLTGMTPILDPSTGEAVAHVGADVSAGMINRSLDRVKTMITANALLIIVITAFFIYRLFRLSSEFMETDYLTGLRSKSYQDRFLKRQIKKSTVSGKPFLLYMIDLDDFKSINDQYGHQFGDAALKAVAGLIKVYARSVDCCSRYGGDEFCIILPEANLGYTMLVCQWLLKEVKSLELKADGDAVIPVSISIGAALWKSGMTAEQILLCADKALYEAKRTGKGKIVIYTEDLA